MGEAVRAARAAQALPHAPICPFGSQQRHASADATGDSTKVTGLGTRAISSKAIGPAIGRDLLGGWVELESESPAPVTALAPNDQPDLSNGPHFFYALQWWFFGLLAVGGFFYLMYDERRLHLHAPATAVVDDAAPASDKVAAVRAAASDARKAKQREKNARKQALAAAYAKAREADDANRTKAFGTSVERSKHRTDA